MFNPVFRRYIGVDYSGARTAETPLRGLRCYAADAGTLPTEILPGQGRGKHWTRRGLALWLAERMIQDAPVLAGIDHAFSFPAAYFAEYGLGTDWRAFLDDFQRHWPTDAEGVTVDDVRTGARGDGLARSGNARRRRVTEKIARAKSAFHFDVPGSVAKSTHAGLPWLRYLCRRMGARVHFWPFDGWEIPLGRSVVAEVYPALWSSRFPKEDRTADQHDAYAISRRLRQADREGRLSALFRPALSPEEYAAAAMEGWILGCPGADSPGRERP